MKLTFVEPFMILGSGKDPTKTVYSCNTRKDQSHPHSLQTGSSGRDRDKRVRRMDEEDLGQITGSKENATGELPYVPNKFADTQDHETWGRDGSYPT
jgi:hypothetical protein